MNRNNFNIITILAFVMMLKSGVAESGSPLIRVEHSWARATLASANGVSNSAVFMSLHNNQSCDDILEYASCNHCDKVELHTHIKEGHIMRMRPLKDGLMLPRLKTVRLKPAGLHIMLLGLRKPLVEGQSIALKLHFRKAGDILLQIPVRKADFETVEKNTNCCCEHKPSAAISNHSVR